jgi:hypothetical protein
MKQLLFLLLFPCLALAQYTGNAGQKITLGEQTTADGLVFRGVASIDTVTATSKITRANKQDTSAFLLLDTVTNLLWHYKTASNAWIQAGGGDTTSIAYVNTYGTQTVNGAKTFTSVLTGTRFDPTANTVTGNGMYLPATNSLGFSTAGTQRIHINSAGKVGLGTQMTTPGTNDYGTLNVNGFLSFENQFFAYRSSGIESDGYAYFNLRNAGESGSFNTGETGQFEFYTYSAANDINAFVIGTFQPEPFIIGTSHLERVRVTGDGEMNIGYGATDNGAYKLQVNSQIFATNATIATSDLRFKENIQPLDKGLEIINKLKPVKFNFISTTENNFSEFDEIGFIAQDVEGALSTELFAKAVVKKIDEGKEDSPLGLMTEKLIPILTKAIQEQQALIKALEQRILILENK